MKTTTQASPKKTSAKAASKPAAKTTRRAKPKIAAHIGASPMKTLKKAAKDTRSGLADVAHKTGEALKEAAHEGMDSVKEAVKGAAHNAIHKVADVLDDAIK